MNVHNSIYLVYAKFNGLSCMVPGYRFWGGPIALQRFVHISDKNNSCTSKWSTILTVTIGNSNPTSFWIFWKKNIGLVRLVLVAQCLHHGVLDLLGSCSRIPHHRPARGGAQGGGDRGDSVVNLMNLLTEGASDHN